MEIVQAFDDPRKVDFIYWEGSSFEVGRDGVTRLEVYREAGQCGYVPWVAVYVGEELRWRSDCRRALIHYAEEE